MSVLMKHSLRQYKIIPRYGPNRLTEGGERFMIKEIELVCRKYLDITLTPTEDLIRKIKEDALNSQSITHTWDTIASSIQSDLSSKILNDIIKLWTNIRVHSFAERWTEKIGKGFKKSTRKTLKQKGTEKEN